MSSFAETYPRYDRKFQVSNNLWIYREDVSGSHVRLYLPDLNGCPRLIAINDDFSGDYYVLEEVILQKEFGVHYNDLSLGKLGGYTKVENLDELNRWPAAFYPDGAPRKKQSLEITRPQADALCRLAEIMPASKSDAWL